MSFWTILCSFTTLKTQKIKISEKMKKRPGDIIILQKCTKIMIICCTVPEIWCMTDVIIFHFGLFLHFYPPNSLKNQNFKKNEKNTWRYHHFTRVPKIMIICYTVPEIWCVTDVIIFPFGLFLPSKFQKKWRKKTLEISSFYTYVPKIMIR